MEPLNLHFHATFPKEACLIYFSKPLPLSGHGHTSYENAPYQQENKRLNQELKHEQKLTEQSIEPLKVHLGDLETAVKEQLDK